MEYVEAVNQFIDRHYKEKDIGHIEIDFGVTKIILITCTYTNVLKN